MESVSYLYKKKGSVKQIRHRFVRCKISISSLNIPRVKKKKFAEAVDRRENIHIAISCKRLVIFRHAGRLPAFCVAIQFGKDSVSQPMSWHLLRKKLVNCICV